MMSELQTLYLIIVIGTLAVSILAYPSVRARYEKKSKNRRK